MSNISNPEEHPEKINNFIDIRKVNKNNYTPEFEIQQKKSNYSSCNKNN